jgi:hypothetical protein
MEKIQFLKQNRTLSVTKRQPEKSVRPYNTEEYAYNKNTIHRRWHLVDLKQGKR